MACASLRLVECMTRPLHSWRFIGWYEPVQVCHMAAQQCEDLVANVLDCMAALG